MDTILLTCAYCGSRLEPDEGNLNSGICKCKYCLSTVVIPKNLTQIENWFNRAVELRRNGEFDGAAEVYERILMEEPSDPEAHWGLALSRNGIEFVDDPRTGEKIPTCHRTKPRTILSDSEYLSAVKCAEGQAKAVVEAEARRIHEVQKKIINASSKLPPYDVFISYKELDNYGQRTVDSVLAQDIYNDLTNKGYNVFFARNTLEGKLGQEYEPIIYAALSSAKVMVVVGTAPSNFDAVWVRNEWRRFQLMEDKSDRTIIPVFRNMPAERLPAELACYVALDMGKIGALQDLSDGIGKYIKKNHRKGTNSQTVESDSADMLAYRAESCLKLKEGSVAKQHFLTLTKKYPGDYRGWWGLIRCETNDFKKAVNNRSTINDYYKKVQILLEEKTALLDQIKQTYVDYLDVIAVSLAKKDLESARQKCSFYCDEVRMAEQSLRALNADLQDTISKKNADRSALESEYNAAISSFEEQKKTVSEMADNDNAKQSSFGGLFSLFKKKSMPYEGAVAYTNRGHNIEQEQEAYMQAAEQKKAEFDRSFERQQEELERKIKLAEEKRDTNMRRAELFNPFIELGVERLKKYWHAQLLREVGIIRPVDPQVKQIRKELGI